jgi:hypothetical protein
MSSRLKNALDLQEHFDGIFLKVLNYFTEENKVKRVGVERKFHFFEIKMFEFEEVGFASAVLRIGRYNLLRGAGWQLRSEIVRERQIETGEIFQQ